MQVLLYSPRSKYLKNLIGGKKIFISKKQNKNKKRKPVFKKMYYPKLINDEEQKIIKNDCNLNKNMIISSVNRHNDETQSGRGKIRDNPLRRVW